MPVSFQRLRFGLIPALLLLASSTLALTGCGGGGGKEIKDAIKGKVTLNGQPVSGTVIFVAADGSQNSTPISKDGEYLIPSPPKGSGSFLVKGMNAQPAGSKADAKAKTLVESQTSGKEPPEKYSKKGNDLPTLDYKGGLVTQNLELKD